jgi:SsrA-binding protein
MAKKKDKTEVGAPTIENRKARFDYHIEETLEVGMILRGSEVKSVRKGEVSLGEGYVLAKAEPPQLTLLNVNIGEYAPSGALGHRPTRARPLLAHKREIVKLAKTVEAKGLTIVPLKLYFKEGWAKLLIGVARGKQAHDKRNTIAKREAKRDIDRAMSRKR